MKRRLAATCAALALPWFLIGALAVIGLAVGEVQPAADIAVVVWVTPMFASPLYWMLRDAITDVVKVWSDRGAK